MVTWSKDLPHLNFKWRLASQKSTLRRRLENLHEIKSRQDERSVQTPGSSQVQEGVTG